RIVAVADAFDAMTTTRPYRMAMSYKEAFEELKRYSGTQFDPEVVRCFTKVLKDRGLIAEE
ncbi:MAG: HD domain-containing phosphohydrolase, partial [Nitrospirota bacterium]